MEKPQSTVEQRRAAKLAAQRAESLARTLRAFAKGGDLFSAEEFSLIVRSELHAITSELRQAIPDFF